MDVEVDRFSFPYTEEDVDAFLESSPHVEDVLETACKINDDVDVLVLIPEQSGEQRYVVVPQSVILMSNLFKTSLQRSGYGKAVISNIGPEATMALLEMMYASLCPGLDLSKWADEFLDLYDDKGLSQILLAADELSLSDNLLSLVIENFGKRLNNYLATLH